MSTSGEPLSPYAASEAQSARTFALIGFIFFAITVAILGLVTLVVFFGAVFFSTIGFGQGYGFFFPFPFFFPFGIFLALSLGLTFWSWTSLKDIEAGRYRQAETSSLVLGILGLFVNIISGIFFLLAYIKLTNVSRYAQAGPPPIYAPATPASRFCVNCGRAVAIDAKFCHHCGKELPS